MSETKPAPHDKPAVFIALADKQCLECEEAIDAGSMFFPQKRDGVLCLNCADLDELEYLPAGDAALTRRACKHSAASYVVFKFSRSRKRYERQGTLVDHKAIDIAQEECVADEPMRRARQERNQTRLQQLDLGFVKQFAEAVRRRYPACPEGRETDIAGHACARRSGRVGRTSAAKAFQPAAIDLAVIAHIRHNETAYDQLLMEMQDRRYVRELVYDKVQNVLNSWRGAVTLP